MKNPDDDKKHDDAHSSAKPGQHPDLRPADYLRAMRSHLRNGLPKEAFKVLQQASVHFPDDPLVLSYYGCLLAVVEKKYRVGVDACRKAITLLQEKEMFEEDILYPTFYLNMGRAYLAAGKKQEAIDSFHDGLQYDRGNIELKKEIRSLGMRKSPVIPFLDRSNPINKYIGKILHNPKKRPR